MARRKSWLERLRGHGNIFTPHAGSMVIHVHRESGLAHRTMTLRPWQVKALRLLASRWSLMAIIFAVVSWTWFAIQAARVPFLTQRISTMEVDARRLDTLQQRLDQLQARYIQVQRMLSEPAGRGAKPARATATEGAKTEGIVVRPD